MLTYRGRRLARGDTATDEKRGVTVALAADYPLLDVFWTILIFFAFAIWLWLLIMVLWDNFARRDHSGWAKAGWTVFIIFLPLLGVLVYMIARPPEADTVMTRSPIAG